MDAIKVKRFLKTPSRSLIDLALEMANLTWKEYTAIELCSLKGHSQEYASEQMGVSVDAFQKWHKSAIDKLAIVWSGVWWIEELVKDG